MRLPRLPMASAISASQSIFFMPRGISMSSKAPHSVLGAFKNRYGTVVDFSPVNLGPPAGVMPARIISSTRSEEHTSELQSLRHLVCRLLLEKKNTDQASHARCRSRGPRTRISQTGREVGQPPCQYDARARHRRLPSRPRGRQPLFFLMRRPPPRSTLFPYTTLFR